MNQGKHKKGKKIIMSFTITPAKVQEVSEIDKNLMAALHNLAQKGLYVQTECNKSMTGHPYTVGYVRLANLDDFRYIQLYIYHRDNKLFMLAEYRYPRNGYATLLYSQFIEHFFDDNPLKTEYGDCIIGVQFEDVESIVLNALKRIEDLQYNPRTDFVYFN